MADLIREAPVGQFLRYLTGNRVLLYPEEKPDFVLPPAYRHPLAEKSPNRSSVPSTASLTDRSPLAGPTSLTAEGGIADPEHGFPLPTEEATKAEPVAIVTQITPDGTLLVGWYSTDDTANPLNWSKSKRAIVAGIICLYTFAVYVGSAIHVSSIPSLIFVFRTNEQMASLGLSLYVLACKPLL